MLTRLRRSEDDCAWLIHFLNAPLGTELPAPVSMVEILDPYTCGNSPASGRGTGHAGGERQATRPTALNPVRFRYDRRLPNPDASAPIMQFPYGLSDFATLMEGGYFYQDRTDRIPQLEAAGRQLIFIRPRRFGKSLLLSLLEHYNDGCDRN